jgi:hypothetical protein
MSEINDQIYSSVKAQCQNKLSVNLYRTDFVADVAKDPFASLNKRSPIFILEV